MDELVSIVIDHNDGKQFKAVVSVDQKGEFHKIEKTSAGYSLIAGFVKQGKLSVGIVRFSGALPDLKLNSYEQYFGYANRTCKFINKPNAAEVLVLAKTRKLSGPPMPADAETLRVDAAPVMERTLSVLISSSKAFLACIKP